MRLKLLVALFVFVPSLLFAQAPRVSVAPWNNHAAALSLTFDDGLAVHLDVAGPALDVRGLKGTFYLTVDQLTRMNDWKKLAAEGHELGNHSVTHEEPSILNDATVDVEVLQAKYFLENNFGGDISDYAYPFGYYDARLRSKVEENNFIARTIEFISGTEGKDYYVYTNGPVDWYDIPAHEAGLVCDDDKTRTCDESTYKDWIEAAIAKKAWTTIFMHGIGDPKTGFNPIPVDKFNYLLDYAAGEKGVLWVAPFKEIGAYLRGQKSFEAARVVTDGETTTYGWDLPENMPSGATIKIKISSPGDWIVTQGEKLIWTDSDGLYVIVLANKQATFARLTDVGSAPQSQHKRDPRSKAVVFRP